MSISDMNHIANSKIIDKISADVLRPVRQNRTFIIWMGFLGIALIICLYAYT